MAGPDVGVTRAVVTSYEVGDRFYQIHWVFRDGRLLSCRFEGLPGSVSKKDAVRWGKCFERAAIAGGYAGLQQAIEDYIVQANGGRF